MLNTMTILFTIIVMFIHGNMAAQSGSIFDSGVSDFSKVVHFKGFVDKTILIKDFVRFKYAHITAPSKFGKSTNLDMVKRFLELNVDEEGNRKEINTTENYKLFKNNNLQIRERGVFFDKHFGRYPVIYMDFSEFKDVGNFDSVLSKFQYIVKNSFLKHKYILNNSTLFVENKTDETLFRKYCNGEGSLLTANEVSDALKFLIKYLRRNFNEYVLVFVDDYDSHVQSLLFKYNPDAEQIITFIHSVFEQFLYNNEDEVFGAFLTGLMKVSVFDIASDYMHYGFLNDHDYVKHYGITTKELDQLLIKTIKDDKERENIKNKIVDFYYGYTIMQQRFDETDKVKLYNIWSVLNYLDNLKLKKDVKSYWCNKDCFDILKLMFRFKECKETVKKLLMGESILLNVQKLISKDEIIEYSKLQSSRDTKLSPKLLEFSISLLYNFGFLGPATNASIQVQEIDVHIPNKEVSQILQKAVDDY